MPRPLLCSPQLLELDLSGRTYFVTGGNSGIGLATVEQLAKQGARVLAGCRDVQKSESVFHSIRTSSLRGSVEAIELDLADLSSVRHCAQQILQRIARLDGLINNAGVMNTPKGRTKDGFKIQFGTNHLGHFLLTEILIPLLAKSSPSRIVNVSGCYHDRALGREGYIDFDDPGFERRVYDGWAAYAQSKLANLLYAKDLATRLAGDGFFAFSVHPGWVRSKLMRFMMPSWFEKLVIVPLGRFYGMVEPSVGMQTTLHTLLSPDVTALSGQFFSQTGWYRDRKLNKGGWPLHSPNPHAQDPSLPGRLTRLSRRLVGLPEGG